jgi:UDP-3-O-[3-hydroxymyristoyl] glucosamine N-acyltransferase
MIRISKILKIINHKNYIGSKKIDINRPVPVFDLHGCNNAISWCNDKNLKILKNIETNSIIIVSENANIRDFKKLNLLVVKNPRFTFKEILEKFFSTKRVPVVHSSAKISDTVKIGSNVYIGQNVIIEGNCSIGDNVSILHNTVIFSNTIIGNNVSIGSNNSIGNDGFGFEKNSLGISEFIPHLGNVIIKDNVYIRNNNSIDRALMGSTIIEENVKIDSLTHIAHGVKVGKRSTILGNVVLAGSVKIGKDSWIAFNSCVLNQKKIGNNCLVGIGSVVINDVNDDVVVMGVPATFLRKNK